MVWNTGDPDGGACCPMFHNENLQPPESQECSWHRLFRNEGLGHHQEGNRNQPLAEGEGNIKYENFFFLCPPLQIFFNLTEDTFIVVNLIIPPCLSDRMAEG